MELVHVPPEVRITLERRQALAGGRPDCVIKARFEFYSQLYDPLSISALYASDSMLCYMLKHSEFDNVRFLSSSAIAAADQVIQWSALSKLKVLFSEDRLSGQLHTLDFFRLLIRRWSEICTRHDDWDVAFDLVNVVLDQLIQERWGSELLSTAASFGCVPMLKRLLSVMHQKPELKAELLRDPCSLAMAVTSDRADAVECLLEEKDFEAQLRHLNQDAENVLHLASKTCNPKIFHLVISQCPELVQWVDDRGQNALVRVITSRARSQNRHDSARMLLWEGSCARTTDVSTDLQDDPLRLAVRLGDINMCRVLLNDGKLDPRIALVPNDSGSWMLKDEPQINAEAILQLLQMTARATT